MRAPTFDALEGGIMGDEHRLRRAQIKHRELDLEGRRVDARIASLESLATQATLLSGFSYAVLRPDSVNGLLAGPVMNTPLGVITAVMTVISFCASLWVVYLTGYSSIRARIAFLQGSKAKAIDQALEVLIETQAYARRFFDLSVAALVFSAIAVVIQHSPLASSFPLVIIFLIFMLNGAFYKRKIDKKLNRWTKDYMPDWETSESCGVYVDRLQDRVQSVVAFFQDGGWRGWCIPPCCRSAPSSYLLPFGELSESELSHAVTVRPGAISAAGASAIGLGDAAACGAAPFKMTPPVVRVPSNPMASVIGRGPAFRGWLFMQTGKIGACGTPPPQRKMQKLYCILQLSGLETLQCRAFKSVEYADLFPARQPKRTIDLSQYALVCSEDDEANERLGLQAIDLTDRTLPSFWLRSPDVNSFHILLNLLVRCCAAADGWDLDESGAAGEPADGAGLLLNVGPAQTERTWTARSQTTDSTSLPPSLPATSRGQDTHGTAPPVRGPDMV